VLRLYAALKIAALPGHAALGSYLATRQLLNVGEGAEARTHAARSLSPGPGEPGLATPELFRSARLMHLEACVRSRDYAQARSVLADLANEPGAAGHRLEVDQWRARVEFFADALPPP